MKRFMYMIKVLDHDSWAISSKCPHYGENINDAAVFYTESSAAKAVKNLDRQHKLNGKDLPLIVVKFELTQVDLQNNQKSLSV